MIHIGQHALNWLPSLEPAEDSGEADTEPSGPFRCGQCLAVGGEHLGVLRRLVVPLVRALLLWSGPSAVVWSVRAVVINALDAVPGWTRLHVGQKARKVVAPLLAHNDPAPAVIGKLLDVWVMTTGLRGGPGAVFASARFAVLVVALCCYFVLPASAASGLASTQHVAADVPGVAAIAEAVPSNIFADVFKPSEDEPTTKSARGQIDESSHTPDSTTSRVTNLTLAAGATLGFSEIVASEACIQRGTCYEANRFLPDGTTKGATVGRALVKGAGTSAAILALAKLKKRHPKLALLGSIGLVAWNGYLTKRALDHFPR